MKNISFYFILLFVGLTFLNSCGNEPLDGEFGTTQSEDSSDVFCENATMVVTTALTDVLSASDEERQALCNDLRQTIVTTISTCGDEEGFFQGLLDDLGDDCIL